MPCGVRCGTTQKIFAITMDVRSFYHSVSPTFLLNDALLENYDVDLEPEEYRFTQLFVDSLNCWYRSTPDYKNRPEGA